jgi:voltage-gated potassium channel
MLIEHWRFLDALYMTVHTLATVGFGETHPLSDAGRVFTIILIFAGVGLFLFILNDMVQILVEANPTAVIGLRRMKQKIAKLQGHQIVCGFGRTGQEAAAHLLQNKVPFVIVEQDPIHVKRAEEAGLLVLQGDATTDEVLQEAQIQHASGIICTLPDDTANTFIALTARAANANINIVSRAANPGAETKMKLAGAHMVISPYVICGRRMATAVTHPLVLEFLDVAMHSPGFDLRLEQIVIPAESGLIDKTLRDANIKQISGVMVLAVSKHGKLITNPSPDLSFNAGDIMIALGTEVELKNLVQLTNSQSITSPIPN